MHDEPLRKNKIITFPPLRSHLTTDVLVIGGGIATLSAAYRLKELRQKAALIEMNLLASGTSGRGTGILSPGFDMD